MCLLCKYKEENKSRVKARFEYPYSLRVKKPDNSARLERKVDINGISHSPPT